MIFIQWLERRWCPLDDMSNIGYGVKFSKQCNEGWMDNIQK